MQKEVTYSSTNTYDTLNKLTPKTKNVWLVFHGIGYLSRYFIRLFDNLDSTENYIIAPQAPSKYYKGDDYRRVGASWLTKENTKIETENVLRYISQIFEQEQIPKDIRLIVLGYSQGVSIASRWIAKMKMTCNDLIFISGGFPKELSKSDFAFLEGKTKITHIVGKQDPYFDIDIVEAEKIRVKQIMPQIEFITHPGGHELDTSLLKDIIY
ncbi:alpha/beta hydrolase [Aquimarina pacifica]|uniref:alpha/beta hydrolase n=1 Tax=Aquimarina pacifica TaxID=1296415 RepID=UPI00046E6809|nr:esterase [Aquimarina pacifica]